METREENEDSEYQEEASNGRVNIDNLSQNMKSNMTIANCETAESERDLQESGVGLDTQSSLPEVVIVDGLFYFSAFFWYCCWCWLIMFLQISQVVKPCGRINSCMAVGRDTLYLYGGTMEIKDREITLDDLYTLNLSKLDEWKCIKSVCYIFLTQFYKISIQAIV